ncbi:MAG: metallophosphoesterase [Planctomycetales bacterium]|nr:metallophosphoesterase [Planctomycetales bacterium]
MPALPLPSAAEPAAPVECRPSRRRFLKRLGQGAAVAAGGAFLYTWRIEPHWVEVVRRPLPIVGLPPRLIGKRLVQVSDLHAGPIVDQRWLIGALERIAELQPDLLVVTGDFMTCDGDEEIPRAMEAVRALPAAPLGRLAILGNHDYGCKFRNHGVADRLHGALERAGVQVLANDVTRVGGLQIAGVEDFYSRRFDPERTLGQLSRDEPMLALCHNPDGADDPAWADYRGWILAGHTHGGQCKAPFFRPPLVPVRNKRYVAGEYDLAPGRQLYINRGLGYLHRVRFNARPEITVFTLAAA